MSDSFYYRYTFVYFQDSSVDMLLQTELLIKEDTQVFMMGRSFNLNIVETYSFMNLSFLFAWE